MAKIIVYMCVTKIGASRCLLGLLLVGYLLASEAITEITNFVAFNTLPDGEIETRIYYDGVTAKETTVGARYVLQRF